MKKHLQLTDMHTASVIAGLVCLIFLGSTGVGRAQTNPPPTVNDPADQVVCNNAPIAAITFTGAVSGTKYNWTNDNPSIGLTASGSGDISSFTAINNANVPVTATITVTPTIINGFAYIPNANSNSVSVINTSTNAVVSTIPLGTVFPWGVSVSPDNTRVYVTNLYSNNVSVINTTSNSVVATIAVGSVPSGISVSPDGNRVYVANTNSHNVSVINTSSNAVIATIPVGLSPRCLSISPNGSQVYVTNESSHNVSVITTSNNGVIATIPVGFSPRGIAISTDNSRVYVVNAGSNNVSVINAASNAVITTIPVGNIPRGVAINSDRVYVTNQGSNSVSVINTSTNSVVSTIAVGVAPEGISISPDGLKVFVPNEGTNNVTVFSTLTNTVQTSIPVGNTPVGFGNFISGCTGTGCTGETQAFTITVNPSLPASLSIAANANSVCENTPVNFTATPTNEGTSPVYQWQINGSNVGSNNPTFSYTPENGDLVTCDLTSNSTCETSNPVESNILKMTVNPIPTVDDPADQVVCENASTAPVTFTGSSGTTFNWTNNNPGIGLAASGTGNIASFTATNTTNSPVTSTITVTPNIVSGGFAYITNTGSNSVSVVNAVTNTIVANIAVGSYPIGVSVSPDGSRVFVVNSASSNVSIINTSTNTVVATIPVGSNLGGIAISPDGSRVFVANQSPHIVFVINTSTNAVVATIPAGSNPREVSVIPDGSRIYVTNNGSDNVSVINTSTNAVVATIPVGSGPLGITVSPDGSRVFVANINSNNVSVINTSTNAVVATIPVGALPLGITVSPDGSRVFVANDGSGNVSVINTSTNSVVTTIPVGSAPAGVSVSPDGSRVFVANFNSNSVSVINTSTNAVIATVSGFNAPYAFGNFIAPSFCAGTQQSFTITVNPALTASVSASASANPVCAGTTVTFTATPVNGGTTPAYQWYNGTTAVGTNSPTYAYDPDDGDEISVVMTSSSECVSENPATSPPITMIVNELLPASVSIEASAETVCEGTTVTFTATAVNGGSAPIYQWKIGGADIVAATGETYSYVPAGEDEISVVMTSSTECASGSPAISNKVTMTVYPPPTITCPSDYNVNVDPGICGASVSFSATADGTPAPLVTYKIGSDVIESPYLFPAGTTTVSVEAVNDCGTANCSFTVTVTDDEFPLITTNGDKTVNADANKCGAIVEVSASALDNCDMDDPEGVRDDGLTLIDPFPVGTTLIAWNVTDANGNEAEEVIQTIVVQDNQVPVISTSGDLTVDADANECGATVEVSASVLDNCLVGDPEGVRDDGLPLTDPFPVGTTLIAWNVTDANGNEAEEVIQTILVEDNQVPVINVDADITQTADATKCSAVVSITGASATDNCGVGDPIGTRSDGLSLSAPYPVGTTTITWTVNDIHDNEALPIAQEVTVTDDELPTIICPSAITVSTDAGMCYATITSLGTTTTNDNCGVASVTNNFTSQFPDGHVPFGSHVITWTVTDMNDNSNSCSQYIYVNQVITTTTVTVTPGSQQYSDKVTFTANVTACSLAGTIGGTVEFMVGSQVMGSASVQADGTATLADVALLEPSPFGTSPTGEMAPGVKTVTASYSGSTNYLSSSEKPDFTITREAATVTYNGGSFFGANPSTYQGTIVPSAFVVDAADGSRGDIRNATVTFRDGSAVGPILGSADIPVGLVSSTVTTEGFASTSFNYTLSNSDLNAGGKIWDVWTVAGKYYNGQADGDGDGYTPVTLGLPGPDYVTGGGHIVMSNSSGIYAGDAGRKMNFGLVMKWNKSGKNLQGNINIIYRKGDRNYQIKSNAINSLVIQSVDNTGKVVSGNAVTFRRATISTKANLKRLNPDGSTTDLGGNLTLTVTAWESTTNKTGALDRIGVQLAGNNGSGINFSSNWAGGNTVAQQLDGGKIQVQTPVTKSAQIPIDVTVGPTEPSMKAYPNPFTDKLNIEFSNETDAHARLEIYSITGAKLQTLFDGKILGGELQTIEYLPKLVSSQMVLYHLILDNKTYIGKVLYNERK